MSVITGRGPAAWCAELGAPLVGRGQLVLLGPRDRDEAADYGSVLPEQAGLEPELTPAVLRVRGVAAAGQEARDRLTAARRDATGCTSTWTCWTRRPSGPRTT